MSSSVEVAYIALGSNLGDRAGYLAAARVAIASIPGVELIAATGVEETAPIGPEQPHYLNQMVAVRTELAAGALLAALLEIELANGRQRTARWSPRTLDLDIVRFGDSVIASQGLVVPHRELEHRPFWLREVAELDHALGRHAPDTRQHAGSER